MLRSLNFILSLYLIVVIGLYVDGVVLAAETGGVVDTAKSPTDQRKDSLDIPGVSLGELQQLVDDVLASDPDNPEALQLKQSISGRGKQLDEEFEEFNWDVGSEAISPYIEIPDAEKNIDEALALEPGNEEALTQLKEISEKKFSLATFLASLEGDRWGGGFRLGGYDPTLSDINQGVFRGGISGQGSVFIDPNDPSAGNETSQFSFDNPIAPMRWSSEAGIEFRWDINRRQSYLIGLSSWEGNSESGIKEVRLPVQNLNTRADFFRQAQFSFTQFYVGWKYNLFRWPDRLRLYTRLTVNEYFDIDYREDHIYSFKEFEISGFKRILITRTQATGAFAFTGGLGAEYFWRDWLSLGVEVNRVVSMASFNLRNVIENTDFGSDERAGFRQLPFAFDARGNMQFSKVNGNTETIKLRFDGWKYIFNVTFYY